MRLPCKSNAESLFKIDAIPTPNQIRNIMDNVSPDNLYSIFSDCFNELNNSGYLEEYRYFNNHLLLAIDGTEYFRSNKIHCECCTKSEHKNGTISYSHKVLLPVITQPFSNAVIPLEPEFVTPQDGAKKQDCELNAAKRWMERNSHMANEKIIVLGDDLFSREPFCKQLLTNGFHFILVCKPDSHKTLYQYLHGLDENDGIATFSTRKWNGRFHELATFSYCNNLPIKDGDDALNANWIKVSITNEKNKKLIYENSFITDFVINNQNAEKIVRAGRSRWKVENENNNILKTKGYHLEHNFGHGDKYLSSTLLTLNLLAFLSHIFLGFVDTAYSLVRKDLSTIKTFFNDFRALTKYLFFDSWANLIKFMAEELELKIPSIKDNSS